MFAQSINREAKMRSGDAGFQTIEFHKAAFERLGYSRQRRRIVFMKRGHAGVSPKGKDSGSQPGRPLLLHSFLPHSTGNAVKAAELTFVFAMPIHGTCVARIRRRTNFIFDHLPQ